VYPCDSRPRKGRARAARTQLATAVQETGVGSAGWDRAKRLQQTPHTPRAVLVSSSVTIEGAHP